jgi:hypothetical protein
LELLLDVYDMGRSQISSTRVPKNVPKTKVEGAKPVEITGDQKKILRAESLDLRQNIKFDTKFPTLDVAGSTPVARSKFPPEILAGVR